MGKDYSSVCSTPRMWSAIWSPVPPLTTASIIPRSLGIVTPTLRRRIPHCHGGTSARTPLLAIHLKQLRRDLKTVGLPALMRQAISDFPRVLEVRRHDLLVLHRHWLNVPILLGLILSGVSIYWASPIYQPRIYGRPFRCPSRWAAYSMIGVSVCVKSMPSARTL